MPNSDYISPRGLISDRRPQSSRVMAKIKYDNWASISYAKAWCGRQNNPCGKYLSGANLSDCAHFMAHVLKAGGIEIRNTDPSTAFCPHGLAVRNTVLVPELL